jgi:MoxR-like ATPase
VQPDAALQLATQQLNRVREEIGKVIVGQQEVVDGVLICLLAGGHVLLEGVPGLGKTTLLRTLSRVLHLKYSRIQFTPDLMPGDIVGSMIIDTEGGAKALRFQPGPIFAHLVLADEINRATPKTQSALLEAMNELQVTVDGRSYPLSQPFMVIATQNPVEHHGTYPLPESQLDRFLMRIRIGYPDHAAERQIVRQGGPSSAEIVHPVISGEELTSLQEAVSQVAVDETLVDYMLAVVERTRTHESLAMGVSPRGAQALFRATQGLAAVEGRDYATPDDVKRLVLPVFAHRIVVNTRVLPAQKPADAAERVLTEILTLVDVPL